jgi:hypothetical protein
MRAALKLLIIAGAAAAVAGCQKQPPQDQNIVITDEIPANADIEALPPDESTETPSDQLENGSDNANVSDLNAPANSY